MAKEPAIIGPATEFEFRFSERTRVAWFDYATIQKIERHATKLMGMQLTIFDLTTRPSPTTLAIFLAYGLDHEGEGGMGGAQANKRPTPDRMLSALSRERGRFLDLWNGCVKAITANFPEADDLGEKKKAEGKADGDSSGEAQVDQDPAD